jgi:eukaryotic-like serine/threonine-protein kinase
MGIDSGTFLGPYEILGLVGSGGMGEVYRARDSRLGRFVAIKVLSTDTSADRAQLSRFEREARLASSLNHPNIVTIYDIGEENSIPYIAMELVEGKTLRELLADGPIPMRRTINIAQQIADALAKAHESGIVHRDLKPENVMVTNDGVVKVLDFGLGKNAPQPIKFAESTILASANPTNPGTILGTVDYMSPEQASGKDTDFRSDQFSLGSIIYEMTAGRRAFRRETAVQTMSAIIADASPKPVTGAIPVQLREIVERCLEKNPKKRYPATRDLVTALRELSALVEVSSAGLSKIVTVIGLQRRRRLKWAVAAVAGLLLVTGALIPSVRRSVVDRLRITQPLPESKSLVVLPFVADDASVDNKQFAAGLTEGITTALTPLTVDPSLQMSPASEVATRRISTVEDAKSLLAANLVLTGRFERLSNALRVHWSIDDASTKRSLRSRTISVKASEPLELETQTVASIIEALDFSLTPAQVEALLVRDTPVAAAKEAYLRGRGYLWEYDKQENISHASTLFEEAIQLDPAYARAYAGLGEAHRRSYDRTHERDWIERARDACQRAIATNDKIAAGHGCLGHVFFSIGSYEDALKEYQRALDIDPTNDDFRREASRVQERLGRSADAENMLKEAVRLRPQYWANYNGLGGFYFNQTKYAEAADMYAQVIKLAPDTTWGYTNLGAAYIKLGRYDEAIPMLERGVSIRPTALAYSNLGTTYFQRRRFPEAAATFEKATKLDEKNYALWGNLGDAYYWAPGKRDQSSSPYRIAIALGEEALKVNPNDAVLLSRLAQYRAMVGEKNNALSYLKVALNIAPNDAEVRFKAALIYNQFKEDDQTLDWLEKAVKAGYSVTTILDAKNFDHLWAYSKFQDLIRKQ